MVAHVNTVAFQGVDVVGIDVQVQMASGLPAFTIALSFDLISVRAYVGSSVRGAGHEQSNQPRQSL